MKKTFASLMILIGALAMFAGTAAAAGPYNGGGSISSSTSSATAGSTITLSGSGYAPGETVKVYAIVNGVETLVASAVANADGTYSVSVKVPANATGSVTFQARSAQQTVSTVVTVSGSGGGKSITTTTAAPAKKSSGLAFTGGSTVAVKAGAVLAALGTVLLLSLRRTRKSGATTA